MAGSIPASPIVELAVPLEGRKRRASPGEEVWRKFRRHRMAVASVGVLALLTSAVLFGPLLWQVPINEIDFTARLATPSWVHPVCTDAPRQDLAGGLSECGRLSLSV